MGTAKAKTLLFQSPTEGLGVCCSSDLASRQDVRFEAIGCSAVCARNKMSMEVNSDLDRMMPHLFLHVRHAFSLLQHEARISVPQIV